MKLTKKDFFNGQEMTEREKRINDQWQTDYNNGVFVFSILFFCLGAMLMLINFIIKYKNVIQ